MFQLNSGVRDNEVVDVPETTAIILVSPFNNTWIPYVYNGTSGSNCIKNEWVKLRFEIIKLLFGKNNFSILKKDAVVKK